MSAASTLKTQARQKAAGQKLGRASASAANRLAHIALRNGHIAVDVSMPRDTDHLALLREALASAGSETAKTAEEPNNVTSAKRLAAILEKAAERFLRNAFSTEFDRLISEYRVMLRESLAKGDDVELKAALNRARLQERILAATPMADQGEACELLGLSGANPSATMKRKEERREVLRFSVEGRAAYPLLQFDVEGRRVYPVMAQIIAARPEHWSDFRLLHWLTRPHLDFEEAPAAALGTDPEAVFAAFEREIEPEVHG